MLNVVFTDEGLVCIEETAYIKQLDMISTFIGSLVNFICSEPDKCPISAVGT